MTARYQIGKYASKSVSRRESPYVGSARGERIYKGIYKDIDIFIKMVAETFVQDRPCRLSLFVRKLINKFPSGEFAID